MSDMQDDDQDELDQISTIALLIDDLSSEDPNAKLHSIMRLKAIAALLGAERTATELIPMLTELIDKIDCNPELMMHLAAQLGSLTEILATSENISQLLDPLEVMVGNDDSVVRDKAIESMRKVGKLLDSGSHLNEMYLPLLKRQRKGDLFSMRISACFLYADIYATLQDQDQRAMVRKKFTKLSNDDTPMVRRGAAQSIPIITKDLERKHAVDFLLPIIKSLLEDQNDSVKIHAV
jgi:serine/threonine-protein phosphatase 2A regulatory subunit A